MGTDIRAEPIVPTKKGDVAMAAAAQWVRVEADDDVANKIKSDWAKALIMKFELEDIDWQTNNWGAVYF